MQAMTRELAKPPLSPWSPEYRHLVFRATARRRQSIAEEREQAPGEEAEDIGIDDEGHAFLRWLFRESGLDVEQYRLRTLRRRLPACLRGLRAGTFAEARRVIQNKPALRGRALSTLVIGVTSFFRDPAVYQSLKDELLP